ncbi:MAG: DUF4198 domain-containing protein [Candidatus Methanosuratincola petrocarbonis]
MTKNTIIIGVLVLLLIEVLVAPVDAHALWVESKDVADVGNSQKVYSFYGHVSSSAGMSVPLIDTAYLITPNGQKLDLVMKKGDWLPGFGWAEHLNSDIALYWPGDYVFVVARSPSVYDPGWAGTVPSNPRLGYSYAKMVIHAGNETNGNWSAMVPIDIIPETAPYEIKVNENITFSVEYQGAPVNATYSAYYWTWDAHAGGQVQTGSTGDQGKFTVNFAQAGPWQISAYVDVPQQGIWTATYNHSGGRFKVGDEVPYNTTRYSMVMSLWVRS